MFKAARRQIRTIAALGVAAALAVGGVAVAQGDSQGAQGEGGGKAHAKHRGGPPPLGVNLKGMTYAEVHIQTKSGEAQVIRFDQGKIAAVSESSITVTENDDNEVTIAVDSDTKVVGKPGSETTVSDLKVGQRVTVSGPDGGSAKAIMLAPKKGEMKPGRHGDGPPPMQGGSE